jgi:hypothetical protein
VIFCEPTVPVLHLRTSGYDRCGFQYFRVLLLHGRGQWSGRYGDLGFSHVGLAGVDEHSVYVIGVFMELVIAVFVGTYRKIKIKQVLPMVSQVRVIKEYPFCFLM